MVATTSTLALCFSLFAAAVRARGVSTDVDTVNVNTPWGLTVCGSAYLSWDGGYAPYSVSIVGGSSEKLYYSFGNTSATNLTWSPVSVAEGQYVAVRVADRYGYINYSQGVTIGSSNDTSCLGTSASGVYFNATASMTASSAARTASASRTALANGTSSTGSTGSTSANVTTYTSVVLSNGQSATETFTSTLSPAAAAAAATTSGNATEHKSAAARTSVMTASALLVGAGVAFAVLA